MPHYHRRWRVSLPSSEWARPGSAKAPLSQGRAPRAGRPGRGDLDETGVESRSRPTTFHKKKTPVGIPTGVTYKSLAVTYSHTANAALPSALARFTSEFGMESGGSTSLLPPGKGCEAANRLPRLFGKSIKSVVVSRRVNRLQLYDQASRAISTG